MIEHNNYLDALLDEFQKRNPEATLAIDYAEGVVAETDYPAEIHIAKVPGDPCRILIDINTPYSDILMFVAEGLASVEAGFDADDADVNASADHYTCLLAQALRQS